MVEAASPDLTFHSAADAFYAVLHAAADDSKADAERLLPVAEMQVERHRQIVAELRSLQERAEAELDRWAAAAGNLRAALDPGVEPTGAALRGRSIAETAVRVLEESGKPQPIHYRDWMGLVRLAGYTIGGADPSASFLTALHRHKRAESIGARSGLWKIAEAADG